MPPRDKEKSGSFCTPLERKRIVEESRSTAFVAVAGRLLIAAGSTTSVEYVPVRDGDGGVRFIIPPIHCRLRNAPIPLMTT